MPKTTTSRVRYYAVPDPNDPIQMTYWRRDERGRLDEWPAKAHYGPQLPVDELTDFPADERRRRALDWYRDVRGVWHQQVADAIEAAEEECQMRFAKFASRCCLCGRTLTDSTSKVYGIGPDCREGAPESWLAKCALAMGRLHGEHVQQRNEMPESA